MKQVREFQLYNTVQLDMPRGAKVLSVGSQSSTLCLWALVDPGAEQESRLFEIVGTGEDILDPDEQGKEFLGTVLMDDLVWHIFEVKGEQ